MVKAMGKTSMAIQHIIKLTDDLAAELPETYDIVSNANLVVCDSVSQITLHGSRGLRRTARPDSDIDLALMVDSNSLAREKDLEEFLRKVFFTTLDNWKGNAALDLAILFDKNNCGLKCFSVREFDPGLCETTIDCLGFFKVQKGFNGFVSGPAVDCSKMYPFIKIWERTD
jgi:predicted nucleotidyltransferase